MSSPRLLEQPFVIRMVMSSTIQLVTLQWSMLLINDFRNIKSRKCMVFMNNAGMIHKTSTLSSAVSWAEPHYVKFKHVSSSQNHFKHRFSYAFITVLVSLDSILRNKGIEEILILFEVTPSCFHYSCGTFKVHMYLLPCTSDIATQPDINTAPR